MLGRSALLSRPGRVASLGRLALILLVALPPLLPLLHPSAQFWGDWRNHLWLIGYFGEYFLRHGDFPVMINTNELIGSPIPLFYGFLFYPMAGLLSAITGANLAIRSLAAALILLQTIQVVGAVEAAGGRRSVALTIAFL